MDVMVATPCYAAGCSSIYVSSIFGLVNAATNAGMKLKLEMLSESLITRARARLLARFLASDCTHLFWIDSDIEFKPEAFARLLLADLDVVGGIYPLKQFNWPDEIPAGMSKKEFQTKYTPYPVNFIDHMCISDDAGFAEVGELPTGFMCIKRHVLLKMVEAYPELQFLPENEWDQENGNLRYMLFDSMLRNKRLLSEDYAFCVRWRDIGGKVYADIASKLNHAGVNVWHGDLHGYLSANKADE